MEPGHPPCHQDRRADLDGTGEGHGELWGSRGARVDEPPVAQGEGRGARVQSHPWHRGVWRPRGEHRPLKAEVGGTGRCHLPTCGGTLGLNALQEVHFTSRIDYWAQHSLAQLHYV